MNINKCALKAAFIDHINVIPFTQASERVNERAYWPLKCHEYYIFKRPAENKRLDLIRLNELYVERWSSIALTSIK